MNLYGSYTALRNNSKSALFAAIEIYNKPQIAYRNECFIILLVNAWELLLKSILSKNRQRIFYPKRKNEPYRSLSIQDALVKSEKFFPKTIPFHPVAENINLLVIYRNNAIHFYNRTELDVLIYGLAQTSIINFRDLFLDIFSIDIADEISLSLLPLSFGYSPDPIEFLQQTKNNPAKNRAVNQFINEITKVTNQLESSNQDTGRFLTVFKVQLQSVKKISAADIVVGIDVDKNNVGDDQHIIIERRIDPNISHPLRRKDVIAEIGNTLAGKKFTTHTFEAIMWKFKMKQKPNICWRSSTGGITKYSRELPSIIKKMSANDIKTALEEYQQYLKKRRKSK